MEPFTRLWFDATFLYRQIAVQVIGNWPVSLGIFILGLFEPTISRSRLVR
jgi:hypothetical protein